MGIHEGRFERRNEGESINLIRAHLAPVHKSVILSWW